MISAAIANSVSRDKVEYYCKNEKSMKRRSALRKLRFICQTDYKKDEDIK